MMMGERERRRRKKKGVRVSLLSILIIFDGINKKKLTLHQELIRINRKEKEVQFLKQALLFYKSIY